ncbi:unnamed protein product [Thlaspi arvense]|uniref:Uncharacterized protein n=1 Tax=Thlaspi arvense TaxID=13288 RepID=A0AAU9SBG4_THLAR|nr:unnamed protein product [Thlaspi arvense]
MPLDVQSTNVRVYLRLPPFMLLTPVHRTGSRGVSKFDELLPRCLFSAQLTEAVQGFGSGDLAMDADKEIPTNRTYRLIGTLFNFLLKCIFRLLSFGPIPQHIAFILDGTEDMQGSGLWRKGRATDWRKPHEVQYVMDLMQEKIEGLLQEQKVLNRHGIRVYFVGDLKYLTEPVRSAAFRVMEATAGNSRFMIAVCVGYTSTYEIAHAGINGSTEGSKGEEKMALKPGEEALSLGTSRVACTWDDA